MSDERPPIHRYPLELKKHVPAESEKQMLEKTIEQMKQEVNNKREKVSDSAKALFDFCSAHQSSDPLFSGVPKSKNSFVRKPICDTL